MSKINLNRLLTKDIMLNMAGDKFFTRGVDYYSKGVVENLLELRDAIKATVVGTYDYKVKIQLKNNGIGYTCNCPVGQNGLFCKHLVATGLA